MSKRRIIKPGIFSLVLIIGMFVATTSGNACWLLGYNQRKCPESLIKED